MTLTTYIACFLVAIVGMALQIGLKIKGLQDRATAGNIKFSPWDYFKNDYMTLICTVITIILFLFFLGEIVKWQPAVTGYLKIGFGFLGYTGADIASRLFSVVSDKINAITDTKTTKADGTADNVTPIK